MTADSVLAPSLAMVLVVMVALLVQHAIVARRVRLENARRKEQHRQDCAHAAANGMPPPPPPNRVQLG